jgi:SAM-dependent methyltransferase
VSVDRKALTIVPHDGELDACPPCWCGGLCAVPIASFDVEPGRPFRMLQCDRCGTARLDPPPDERTLAEAYATEYYGRALTKFRGPLGHLFGRMQRRRARRVARLLPSHGTVLDVGCGGGDFLIAISELGFEAVGTERTVRSASRAAASTGIGIHTGDLLTLDLPPGTFDLVTFWHVLEHLEDPPATLRRVHELLRPGGSVLVTVPMLDSWQARLFRGHWFHHDPPRHLWAFGQRSLHALLRQSGFAPVACRTLSLVQNPYGALQSFLNALGFPRDRAYALLKGIGHGGWVACSLDATLLGLLAGPSLAFALGEAAAGSGATAEVVARRVSDDPEQV